MLAISQSAVLRGARLPAPHRPPPKARALQVARADGATVDARVETLQRALADAERRNAELAQSLKAFQSFGKPPSVPPLAPSHRKTVKLDSLDLSSLHMSVFCAPNGVHYARNDDGSLFFKLQGSRAFTSEQAALDSSSRGASERQRAAVMALHLWKHDPSPTKPVDSDGHFKCLSQAQKAPYLEQAWASIRQASSHAAAGEEEEEDEESPDWR